MADNPFPWPAEEREETPTGFRTPEQWWRELHPSIQKQWAPILRAMTPEQRVNFHAERRKVSRELPDEHARFFHQQSIEARDQLFNRWSRMVTKPQRLAGCVS